MTKHEQKRAELEVKILAIFESLCGLSKYRKEGIGKYKIKTLLLLNDKNLRISINTVKKIVDHFLDVGKIECVNPHAASRVRFRLREV